MNEIKAALDKEGEKIKEALEKIGYEFMTLDIENYCIGEKHGIGFRIRARLKAEESGQVLS